MKSKRHKFSQHIEGNLPSIELYEKHLINGVNCHSCGEGLSNSDIISHRQLGITEAKEMNCFKCWEWIMFGTK